jgi:hypothetical protein
VRRALKHYGTNKAIVGASRNMRVSPPRWPIFCRMIQLKGEPMAGRDDRASDADADIALTKAMALYDIYVQLARYADIPKFDPHTTWAHDPALPLSLVMAPQK